MSDVSLRNFGCSISSILLWNCMHDQLPDVFNTYTTSQRFLNSKIFNVFKSLLLTKPVFMIQSTAKIINNFEISLLYYKRTVLNIFKNVIHGISKLNFLHFSIINPVTESFRNHSNILICCSKILIINSIAEYNFFRFLWWIERSEEQHL